MGAIKDVLVPDIGDFKDVEIIEVSIAAGEHVNENDPLITLESDKASMEVPAPEPGTIVEVKVAVGDRVSEGSLVATLETGETETAAEPPSPQGQQETDMEPSPGTDKPVPPPPPAPEKPEAAPPATAPSPAAEPAPSAQIDEAAFAKAYASPTVRRFARELGADLGQVAGSGRKGRIRKEDVTAFVKGVLTSPRPAAEAPAAAPAPAGAATGAGVPPIPAVDFSQFGETEEVPLPRIKKISGPVLHRAWLNIPHVTNHEDADITEIDGYRKELDTAAKEEGYRVTLLSFLMKASVSALKTFPLFNASLSPDGASLIMKHYFHIGVAVDTPGGLVVPVIRDVDRKGIVNISKELGEVSARAREGKLGPTEMQGGCFTISSLGGIGGTAFTPIINAPEVAILGVTRSKIQPVWNGEKFVPRNILPLSLSWDHRVIDGALAARFAVRIAYLLGDVRRLLH